MRHKKIKLNGFTYVEVIIALMFLSMFLAPLLIMFPTGLQKNALASFYTQAANLAEDIMEEVRGKEFEDPDQTPQWGPESGETGRDDYDDVDDYDGSDSNGWTRTPPEDINGNPLNGSGGRPDFSKFTRKVIVENVLDSSLNGPAEPDGSTSFKRITVTVSAEDMSDIVLTTVMVGE